MSDLENTPTPSPRESIQNWMSEISAADGADLFMSPYVHLELLLCATEEDGPAMWIVNRSDIYTANLDKLVGHPIGGIAQRAQDKLKLRKTPPIDLPAALDPDEIDLENLPDHEVEEILGHPQVPLRQISRLCQSPQADHRASTALSLSRRLLEYPPSEQELLENDINSVVITLSEDPSAYVRSYAARIPLITTDVLKAWLEREENAQVLCRLIQSQSFTEELLGWAIEQDSPTWSDPQVQCILALDERLSLQQRKQVLENHSLVNLARDFHNFAIGLST